MSYPILSTDAYTYKQIGILSEARSKPGVHIIYQNGYQRKVRADEGRFLAPKGLTKNVRFTHALVYKKGPKEQKYTVMSDMDNNQFIEYQMQPTLKFVIFWRSGSYTSSTFDNHDPNLKVGWGTAVIETDVDDQEKMMVKYNGSNVFTERTKPGPYVKLQDLRRHQWGLQSRFDVTDFDSTTLEVHVTYEADAVEEVFDHAEAFVSFGVHHGDTTYPSEIPLSVGAFALFEGITMNDANPVVITNHLNHVFRREGKKTDKLQILMKVTQGKLIFQEPGETPQVAITQDYDPPNGGYARLIVNREFKATNCLLVTGVVGGPIY